jgi:DNA sulfur modification protein DndB
VIAARGMRWSKANAVLAADKKIIVWREAELEYYGRLVKHLGSAARFQIYSITFPEARVREPIQVPAIRGGKGKGKYYCFVTQPDKLLQVAYVHHRRSTPQELQESYQRMLNRSRLNRISDFITGGGYFANNIIINFIERPTFRPFPKQQQAGEVAFGMLEFPREYASAWIIDGQHRLYGYADNPKKQDATVAVLAFDRLPVKEQAKLFVDINREQKAVPPNLLWDLYSDIYYDSPEAQDQTWRTISLVVKRLDSDKDSPLRDHVRIPSVTPKGRSMTNLTMATVCEALKETRLLNATEGLLYATDYESTVEFAAQRLKAYLSLAAHAFPQDWGKGDRGLLRTNIGIRILLIILKEILLYFRNLGEERIYKRSDLSEFRTRTEKLLRPMLDKLDEIGDAGRNGIRRQTAKGLVLDNARQIAWEIRETFEGFGLELLRNWAPPVPSGVTDEDIRSLLQDTERRLRSFIAQELETLYGKRWWGQGVPAGVKSGVATRVEREVRRAPFRDELRRLPPARRMNYTDTPHLREIIEYGRNWDHFKHLFVEDKEFTSVQFRCFELVRHKYAHHAEEELDEIEKNQGYWGMKWIRRCRGWDTPRA